MIPMPDADQTPVSTHGSESQATPPKALSPAAQRALAEADARRTAEEPGETVAEVGGRGGADPARYGDWEINGRAIDF